MLYLARWKMITVDQSKVLKTWLFRFLGHPVIWAVGELTNWKMKEFFSPPAHVKCVHKLLYVRIVDSAFKVLLSFFTMFEHKFIHKCLDHDLNLHFLHVWSSERTCTIVRLLCSLPLEAYSADQQITVHWLCTTVVLSKLIVHKPSTNMHGSWMCSGPDPTIVCSER